MARRLRCAALPSLSGHHLTKQPPVQPAQAPCHTTAQGRLPLGARYGRLRGASRLPLPADWPSLVPGRSIWGFPPRGLGGGEL